MLDRFLRIPVGRGDDPHVYVLRRVAPYGANLAFLQETQELRLHFEGHVTDFIEEDGALICNLKQADLISRSSRERAFDVPEEFAFDEVGAEGRTIDRDQRTVLSRTITMDSAGDHLFAGAGLTEDQHRRGGRSDLFDLLGQFMHSRVVADDESIPVVLRQFALHDVEAIGQLYFLLILLE